jgi:hypothetical protein
MRDCQRRNEQIVHSAPRWLLSSAHCLSVTLRPSRHVHDQSITKRIANIDIQDSSVRNEDACEGAHLDDAACRRVVTMLPQVPTWGNGCATHGHLEFDSQ